MLSEAILYSPISELSKRIQSKQLSPVELTESYLARSEALGPKLNAYARLTPDLALDQAKAAEKEIHRGHYRGPLHGISYAAKDLLAVKGLPTTWGAKPFADQVFDHDATVIGHLHNVGAILLGKAAMIELAGGMGYMYASASLQAKRKIPGINRAGPAALLLAPPPSSPPDSPLSPSARKPGAPLSALPPSAASAVCAPPTAASAATARWRSPTPWTKSARWHALLKIARTSSLQSPATIRSIAACSPSIAPPSLFRPPPI